MKILIKKLLSKDFRIHIYVTIGFILASVLFYHPLLQGKKLFQSDIAQYEGMSREIKENREKQKNNGNNNKKRSSYQP